MKWNHWVVVVVLLLFMWTGLRMGSEVARKLEERDATVIEMEQRERELRAEIAALEEQLAPPSYTQPLPVVQVSSPIGYRDNPMGGGNEHLHKGVDLSEMPGVPVKATLAGRVREHWLAPGVYNGVRHRGHPEYGGMVSIEHRDGSIAIYGHFSMTNLEKVREGWWVEEGTVIGWVGNTGMSTGPHLHFEIVVDPFKYLSERRKQI